MKWYTEFVLFVCFIVLLPGCGGRVTHWFLDNFNQAGTIKGCVEYPYEYVRTATINDQVNTVAMFDALWLSDTVRRRYVDLRALRFSLSSDQKENLLQAQLKENERFITFYVLSLSTICLAGSDPVWALSLEVDDKIATPVEIKVVRFDQEYRAFFGELYIRPKSMYQVKFNALDGYGNPLITNSTQMISLWFRSVNKEEALTWCMSDIYEGYIDKKVYEPVIWG
ncbi:MAG: hypothetical protein M1114_02115 [Candidatus Dependentiae bacterium]|nr:hypothetical protein [Candidatus Dependentiae bacterium]